MPDPGPAPGAAYLGDGTCRFVVWAPESASVEVVLEAPDRRVALTPVDRGYHEAVVQGVEPGARYRIRLGDGPERPDPGSRFQPLGVHGPSEVVDPRFPWTDASWTGRPLDEFVFYEIHVGLFTREGTFDAAIAHLDGLRDLGVTAIEIMPVAQVPGDRNWGYDGAFPYAVQNSYGGPAALKRFVDAAHARGLAVALDVVYNHLGPEGNCLWGAAPYFTDRYRTPWGPAVNFDGRGCDEVRRYFIGNALSWIRDFHIDALRLDALHAIVDASAYPFVEELADRVRDAGRDLGRRVALVGESDRNDPRLVLPADHGGSGLDAVWNDDFHHALHALLTGERSGYYADFGSLDQLARAFAGGFVYAGEPSAFRGRRHGRDASRLRADQLVVFIQNHDQIGNRRNGDRLATLVPFEKLKLAAGAVILSANVPLLFMGEEYGETAPFPYFVSHGDPELVEAVRRGRREEFRSFGWNESVPDPQDRATFESGRLDRSRGLEGPGRTLRAFHAALLRLRRDVPAFRTLDRNRLSAKALDRERLLVVTRRTERSQAAVALHFGDRPLKTSPGLEPGLWERAVDSSDAAWGGPGSSIPETVEGGSDLLLAPASVAVFVRRERP